jgi:hypothetical protein
MLRMMKAGLVVAAAVAIVGCGSTSFKSTWKAPDAAPLQLEEGTKIIAMVVSGNTAKRRGFEAALVNELNEVGLEGIAAYSAVPEELAQDAKGAKPYIQKTGASYAIVVQVTGKTQEISSTPTAGAGMYGGRRGFYGGGWGGWGWGGGGGQEIRTDTLVGVETLLYDIEADTLVWAGQSETMNPSKAESFMRELLGAVGDELRKDGLVTGPKK